MKTSKNKKIELFIVYLPFILFLFYLLHTHKSVSLMADDFRYSFRSCFNFKLPEERILNFGQMVQTAYFDYLYYCARYMTSILIHSFLLFGPYLYQIVSPFVFVSGLIFISYVVIGRFPNKYKDLIVTVGLVATFGFVPSFIIDEDVYWITGAITYGWPILFITLFFIPYYERFNNLKLFKNKFVLIFYILLATIVGSLSENLSISSMVIATFIMIFQRFIIKQKKFFNSLILITYITLLTSNIIQLISPGTHLRYEQLELPFLNKMLNGFLFMFQYLFIDSRLIIIFVLFSVLIVVKKYFKRWFYPLLILYLPLILFDIFILHNALYAYVANRFLFLVSPLYYYSFKDHRNIFMIIQLSYFFLILSSVILIFIKFSLLEKNIDFFILCMLSSLSIISLVATGGAASRTVFFAYIMMGALSLNIFYREFNNRYLLLSLLVMGLFSFSYSHIYIFDNVKTGIIRNKIYSNIKVNQKEDITIPFYRFSIHGNFTDVNSWEYQSARLYYNLLGEIKFERK